LPLKVGDVIRWDNFPYPRDNDVKPRWFIYLGRTSIFKVPVFSLLCTTTTQFHHFEPGGTRSNHAYRLFSVKEFRLFDKDCILDFEEDLHDISQDILERCSDQIQIKGRLDENTMRSIYKQFSRPGVVSKVILIDIYDSFNRDGITGLKKPK